MNATNHTPKNRFPAPPEIAAADNLSPAFLLILEQIGFEVVIVRFQALNSSPIWKHAGLEKDLEKELQAIEGGAFDSESYSPGARFFFFHVAKSKLGAAVQQIKTALAARGLLEITTIFHVETADDLRVWYPPTAELVKTTPDSEA